MTRWHKFWISLLVILFILFLLMVWYMRMHTMRDTEPFEINSPTASQRIVIATQGSAFKDSVVNHVVRALKEKPVYIKVIDVKQLSEINEDDWDAIAILHTWEYSEPQTEAKAFTTSVKNKNKLIIITTSGEGTNVLDNVNGISSASNLANVSQKAEAILARIDKLLTSQSADAATVTDSLKYDVAEISWPPRVFIIKREKRPFDQLSAFFEKYYDEIYAIVEKHGIATDGVPSAIYYSIDEINQETDLAAAVPVKGKLPTLRDFEIIKMPATKIITTTHYGSYESMSPAYLAMDRYMEAHDLNRELIIEEYFSDPAVEKDTAKWMTRINFTIK